MKIFISWSKNSSREIALALQKFLEDFFRKSRSLNIFVSASDIHPGDDWFDTIRDSIFNSNICIIVMTDENELSRWTHFEAGAIAFNTKSSNIIPFLVTSRSLDERSPLRRYQYVQNTPEEISKLVKLVKKEGGLRGVRDDEFDDRFDALFPKLSERISEILDGTVTDAHLAIPFGKVYPTSTTEIEPGKVFVGAAMASLQPASYEDFRKEVAHIADAIEICCPTVRRTYWAGKDITSVGRFDGLQVALLRDLGQLKSSEVCVFIFFESLPSSVLVEIGYAIALNKRIIVFCRSRDNLPFLLKRADEQITNLSVFECDGFRDIEHILDTDGEALIQRKVSS